MKKYCLLICVLFYFGTGVSNAQYHVLHNFNDTAGAFPISDLLLSNGLLYGMTPLGGYPNPINSLEDVGVVFSIDTTGTKFNSLQLFNYSSTGANPDGAFIRLGNRLYGTTSGGGGASNVFSVDTSFNGYSALAGSGPPLPNGSLVSVGGILYGMTPLCNGFGTIFSLNTNGSNYKDVHNFDTVNGSRPHDGKLIFSSGKLYGMTQFGGAANDGVVFSVDTNGSNYKKLLDFNGVNGSNPQGALILSGNVLYGMTNTGGAHNLGTVFSVDTTGNNYKDLYDFDGTTGAKPMGSLLLSGKTLYGMTFKGGLTNQGLIFSIDTNGGNYVDMNNFDGTTGANPEGSLILSGNTLYGMTENGGTYNAGVIFSIDTSSVASINEVTSGSFRLRVFPNPGNGLFSIQLNTIEVNATVEVYNVLGEKVFKTQYSVPNTEYNIDISNQPDGIYLYRVMSGNGNLIGTGKLVIQK